MKQKRQNWISLNKVNYKLFHYFNMPNEFKNTDLSNGKHNHVAMAKYGGPIAITNNKEYFNLSKFHDNSTKNNICFFNSLGSLMLRQRFTYTEKLVGFDFLENEVLFVLLETGQYYLIDPFKGNQKKHILSSQKLSFERNKIKEAKTFENGFAFYTSDLKFYYVSNVFEPHVMKFISPQLTQDPSFFIVIPPVSGFSYSERVEVHIAHPDAGIIVLIEDEERRIDYAKPTNDQQNSLVNVKMIAQSPGGGFFSYLTEDNTLWVGFQDYFNRSLTPTKISKQISGQVNQMLWCSEECVVLMFDQEMMIIGPNITKSKILNCKSCFAFPETDGLRIVTNRQTLAFRKIPDSYKNIFMTLSLEPSAMLYEAYISYKEERPLQYEDPRSNKETLVSAVQQCMQAASFEVDEETQNSLLKAALYGKIYLSANQIDHNELTEIAKLLRVVYSVRKCGFPRLVTFEQLQAMDKSLFIDILLRYQLHYLAKTICKFMEFPNGSRLLSKIYIDWAKCKIESNVPEDELVKTIENMLQSDTDKSFTVSFTEIAQYAILINKKQLAEKLLVLEKSNQKKVPVLLSMDKYERALEVARKSWDSNLVNLVIYKMIKMIGVTVTEEQMHEMFSRDPVTSDYLVQYYKCFRTQQNQRALDAYLNRYKKSKELGSLLIKKAYNTDDIVNRIDLMHFAVDFFKQQKDSFFKDALNEHIKIIGKCQKDARKKKKTYVEIPLTQSCLKLLQKDNVKDATNFMNTCKISPKRKCILLLNYHAKRKQWDEFKKIVNKYNTKKEPVVPWDEIADICLQNEEEEEAKMYIVRHDNLDDKIYFLKTAEIANDAQDPDYLQEIYNETSDHVLKKKIKSYIEKLM